MTPSVIFMGTSDFAVPALTALSENGYDVSLVITQPDKPKGRGKNLAMPPVKKEALRLGIKDIIQPISMKEDKVYEIIKNKKPDILAVTSFGHILSDKILNIAPLGAVNIHASLLPKYRGASPIQSAIINREKETGVTTMLINSGIDAGDILYQEKIPIMPNDTAETLHDKLAVLGAELFITTLESLIKKEITPVPQKEEYATYCGILKKNDGLINWNNEPDVIEAFIRGMNPWPSAFTFLKGKRTKIFKAAPVYEKMELSPGSVVIEKNKLYIAARNGALSILELQQESGKRLEIKDFINSY